MTAAPATPLRAGAPEPFLDPAKALACIHCGLCLGSCPTYLETGDENDSPRGRIYLMRALQEGRVPADGGPVEHMDRCLGCRACEAVCPSGVQYGDLLEHTRDHIERHHRRSLWQTFLRRIAIEQVFPFPARMKLALLPAKLLRRMDATHLLPQFAREAMELLPSHFSDTAVPEVSPATTEKPRARAGFVSGCVMSVMFGDTNAASVALLNRAGYEVVTPRDQGCCGALHAHSGRLENARQLARENIAVFERLRLDIIVINAAGCGSTLKEYGNLLRDDPAWAARAAAFSAKVKDLTEVLSPADFRRTPSLPSEGGEGRGEEVGRPSPQSPLSPALSPLVPRGERETAVPVTQCAPGKVTYHDACHLAHAQRVTKPPRELVKAVAGADFVELPESDVCCGSAGTYNLTEPEMAARLQRRKIENILKTGATTVVTTNPGCLLQIQAGLRAAGAQNVRALHIADYLAGR